MARYDCEIFAARDLGVVWGINEGEALGPPSTLCLGDTYMLRAGARPLTAPFELEASGNDVFMPDPDTDARHAVRVLAELRLMANDNEMVTALLLEVDGELALLPLSPLRDAAQYALIGVDPGQTRLRVSQLVYGCFAQGTRIMAGDGRLVAIEELGPDDAVLTRDHGAQPLLWVGKTTVRASGLFAPVTFPAAYLGNLAPLTVGPLQRIFLYQRGGLTANGRSEALVQARHLVDGQRVHQREGGFATYHALVFQAHQIIYAEGVPVESMLVSRATVARLPDDFAKDLDTRFPHLNQRAHFAQEISGAEFAARQPAGRRHGP